MAQFDAQEMSRQLDFITEQLDQLLEDFQSDHDPSSNQIDYDRDNDAIVNSLIEFLKDKRRLNQKLIPQLPPELELYYDPAEDDFYDPAKDDKLPGDAIHKLSRELGTS